MVKWCSHLWMSIGRFTVDHPRAPVPEDATMSSVRIACVWFVMIVNLALMNFGIVISQRMPLAEAFLAYLLAHGILATVFTLSGIIGTRTRLPLSMLLRATLGTSGAKVVAIAIAFTSMGWFGFQLEVFAKTFIKLLPASNTDSSTMQSWATCCGGLLMISTAIIGFRGVERLSQIATPLLLFAAIYALFSLWSADRQAFWEALNQDGEFAERLSFNSAVSMMLSGAALGMLIVSDVTRFGRSVRGTAFATWCSFSIGGAIVFGTSLLIGRIESGSNLSDVLPHLEIGGLAAALLVVATWTTNDTNIYVASLSMTSVIRQAPKWLIASALGTIGILVGYIGIVDRFLPWLSLIGMIFGPVGAVFILDFYRGPHQYDVSQQNEFPNYRVSTAIACMLGTLTTLSTSERNQFGLDLWVLTGIPMLDGALVAMVTYVVGQTILERNVA